MFAAATPFTVLSSVGKPFVLHRLGFRDTTDNPNGARQLMDVMVYVDPESPASMQALLPKVTRAVLSLGGQWHDGKWMTSCKLLSISDEFPDDVLNGTYRTITFEVVSPAYDIEEES